MAFRPVNLRFEHHLPLPGTLSTIGIGESRPRISWQLKNQPDNFQQTTYHLELPRGGQPTPATPPTYSEETQGTSSTLIPWPEARALPSRGGPFARVKVSGQTASSWSDWNYVEAALLSRSYWTCSRISSTSYTSTSTPSPSTFLCIYSL